MKLCESGLNMKLCESGLNINLHESGLKGKSGLNMKLWESGLKSKSELKSESGVKLHMVLKPMVIFFPWRLIFLKYSFYFKKIKVFFT